MKGDKVTLNIEKNKVWNIVILASVIGLTFSSFIAGMVYKDSKTKVKAETYVNGDRNTYEIGNYTFYLMDDPRNNGDLVDGKTTTSKKSFCFRDYCLILPFTGEGSKKVWIRTGRPVGEIYKTCVHETTHNQYPWMFHDLWNWYINEHSENSYEEVCIELIARVKAKSING